MFKNKLKIFSQAVLVSLFFVCGVNIAFGQCGEDGMKPCPEKIPPVKVITKSTKSEKKIPNKKKVKSGAKTIRRSQLIGRWEDKEGKNFVIFNADGTGNYGDKDDTCPKFTFTFTKNILIISIPPSVECGIANNLGTEYKIRFNRNVLEMLEKVECGWECAERWFRPKTNAVKPKPQPKFVPRVPSIEMVKIPAGSFMMGSDNGGSSVKPVHKVIISQGFWMGKTEVTQAQWKAVMGNNSSYFKGDDLPVEKVSWYDVKDFIRKLNNLQNNYEYRLPTEAEWEYAARAGTTGDYAGDLDLMAWNYANSGSKTHAVGQKQPNAFGLYDMHGNVSEWTADLSGRYPSGTVTDPTGATSGSFRVFRGGSWGYFNVDLSSWARGNNSPSYRSHNLGFRVVKRFLDKAVKLAKRQKSRASGSNFLKKQRRNVNKNFHITVLLKKIFSVN